MIEAVEEVDRDKIDGEEPVERQEPKRKERPTRPRSSTAFSENARKRERLAVMGKQNNRNPSRLT